MKNFHLIAASLVLGFTLSACAGKHHRGTKMVKRGEAVLESKQNATVAGKVTFEDHFGSMIGYGKLTGLRADRMYKVQIHEKGDCSARNASSAGAVWATLSKTSGAVVAANGMVGGELPKSIKNHSDLVGKSVVVVAVNAEKSEEYRVACGVITETVASMDQCGSGQCKDSKAGCKKNCDCKDCKSLGKPCGKADCDCGKSCKCGTNCKCGPKKK